MTAPANPIQHSFELAAERCEDLTPLVYRRLHREYPETQSMFRTEGADLVKGSMLALTIDAMLDFAGERTGHFRLIECEVSSHDAYGTPRELFGKFSPSSPARCARCWETTGRPRSRTPGRNCWMRSMASWPGPRRKPIYNNNRHCERSEAIHLNRSKAGLLRRFAPRNDGFKATPQSRSKKFDPMSAFFLIGS